MVMMLAAVTVEGGSLFLWGLAGAVGAELINFRALYDRDRRKWNRERSRPTFWTFAGAFAVFGGVTAWAHGYGASLTPWLAMNVGFTWPLLLRRAAGSLPETDLGAVD